MAVTTNQGMTLDDLERMAFGEGREAMPEVLRVEVLREMAAVCYSALLLIVHDRELTEAIVGDYMDGNNWGNWGGFVARTMALHRVLEENPLPKVPPPALRLLRD